MSFAEKENFKSNKKKPFVQKENSLRPPLNEKNKNNSSFSSLTLSGNHSYFQSNEFCVFFF